MFPTLHNVVRNFLALPTKSVPAFPCCFGPALVSRMTAVIFPFVFWVPAVFFLVALCPFLPLLFAYFLCCIQIYLRLIPELSFILCGRPGLRVFEIMWQLHAVHEYMSCSSMSFSRFQFCSIHYFAISSVFISLSQLLQAAARSSTFLFPTWPYLPVGLARRYSWLPHVQSHVFNRICSRSPSFVLLLFPSWV
jgi:hypothetical protein